MTESRPERRLAGLAADVVGYWRSWSGMRPGRSPNSAVLRNGVIAVLLAEHRGRLVKLLGDGVLAEFASVVDAVACAQTIQDGNTGRAAAADRRQPRRCGD